MNFRRTLDATNIASSVPYVQMRLPLRVQFEPLKDITAYELSKLLPYFIAGTPMYEEDWDRLGAEVTRHLIRIIAK